MFTFFTDRDGKFQLLALAESGFDPLARSARFMLTEEAHHMFVGETGIARVVRRTAELMKQNPSEDARREGGIDLPTMQKYLNLWYSISLDLFGGEVSSNAASFFADGLKGRAKEASHDDHVALEGSYRIEVVRDGRVATEEVPLRNAMNEVLRDAYVEDCQRGLDKWNAILEKEGISFRFRLPSRRFHRKIGIHADVLCDLEGNLLTREAFEQRRDEFLPSAADQAYVKSLMASPILVPGQMASWISAPPHGIKGRPVDFEYVRCGEA
jgi:benzoyl-CoA 2,3-dioxygenase component B